MDQLLLPQQQKHILAHHKLAYVQVFLNASIACILYTRRLINWRSECYLDRNVSQLDFDESVSAEELHDHFCSARYGSTRTASISQEFKIIQSGRHRCADQILKVLRTGVMEALRLGHLSILKLFIAARERDAGSIAETYTFVFEPDERGSPSVRVAEANRTFRAEDLQRSFKKAIKALLIAIRDLPVLPKSGRRLGFGLLYHDTCPINYQPSGFTHVDDHRSATWLQQDESLYAAKFDAGTLSVRIGVGACEFESPTDLAFSAQLQRYLQTSSRDADFALTMRQSIDNIDGAISGRKRKRTSSLVPREEHQAVSPRFSALQASIPESEPDCAQNAATTHPPTQIKAKASTFEALVCFSSEVSGTIPSDRTGEDFS